MELSNGIFVPKGYLPANQEERKKEKRKLRPIDV